MNLYSSVASNRKNGSSSKRTRSKRRVRQNIPPPTLVVSYAPYLSFSDEDEDAQAETPSHDLPCLESSTISTLDQEDFEISSHTNGASRSVGYEVEIPNMSDVLDDSGDSRTICGLKVGKNGCLSPTNDKSISGDSAFSSITSATDSMTSNTSSGCSFFSQNTKSNSTLDSQSGSSAGWTLETQLVRAVERRKRVERRFQRERLRRRTTEAERDTVLNFVKGLLFELNSDGTEDLDRCDSRLVRENKHEKDIRQKTLLSIRDFLLRYDTKSQVQGSERSCSSNNWKESICGNSSQEGVPLEEDEVIESKHNLRSMLESYNRKEEQRWKKMKHDDSLPLSSDDEYSSDSSYDTSEAEDEFPELPVKFRSIRELSDEQNEDDFEEDDYEEDTVEEDATTLSSDTREMRERDHQHAGELQTMHKLFEEAAQEHAKQIESMERKFEKAARKHVKQIESMERDFEEAAKEHGHQIESIKHRFSDERNQREDLLDRALNYAEKQEKIRQRLSKELSEKRAALEQCTEEHLQKVEALQKQQREELIRQRERISEKIAVRHTTELEHLKDIHEEELANQRKHLLKEFTIRQKKQEERRKRRELECNTMLKEARERDSAIEALKLERARKDEEIQKLKESLVDCESKIAAKKDSDLKNRENDRVEEMQKIWRAFQEIRGNHALATRQMNSSDPPLLERSDSTLSSLSYGEEDSVASKKGLATNANVGGHSRTPLEEECDVTTASNAAAASDIEKQDKKQKESSWWLSSHAQIAMANIWPLYYYASKDPLNSTFPTFPTDDPSVSSGSEESAKSIDTILSEYSKLSVDAMSSGSDESASQRSMRELLFLYTWLGIPSEPSDKERWLGYSMSTDAVSCQDR